METLVNFYRPETLKQKAGWKDLRNKEVPPMNEEVWLLNSNNKIVKAKLIKIDELENVLIYEWYTQNVNLQIAVKKYSENSLKPGCYWREDIFLPEDFV